MRDGYRHYLLSILLVLLAFNFIDRVALGLLLQDIKADLRLSDTQLGFLSGIAFALFYSVMGVPIARWADRGNRVTIISLTAALWSIAVLLCGCAASFAQLLLIRVGVAAGGGAAYCWLRWRGSVSKNPATQNGWRRTRVPSQSNERICC